MINMFFLFTKSMLLGCAVVVHPSLLFFLLSFFLFYFIFFNADRSRYAWQECQCPLASSWGIVFLTHKVYFMTRFLLEIIRLIGGASTTTKKKYIYNLLF